MYAKLLHVDAIDEHLALLNIIVARNEVDEGGFSTAALAYNSYRFAFRYCQVDIPQNPLLTIAERYITEFYLMLEAWYVLGTCNFFYSVFC